jgi:hypothetical protein
MRWLTLLVAASMLAAACSDDPGSTDPGLTDLATELATDLAASVPPTSTTTTTLRPPVPTDPPARVSATIGDLEIPCTPSDAVALPYKPGVTEDAIVIGTGSDRGGLATAGAGVGVIEMIEALADHCNAHGGLLGRDILVREYDAAAVEAGLRVVEACEETAALVGHAFLQFFEAELTARACGLPTYPNGQGLLQPNPFPLHGVLSALFLDPKNAAGVAVVGPDTPAGALDRQRVASAIAAGTPILNVVGNLAYPIDGAPDWNRIVGEARALGAGQVHLTGSCAQAVIPFMEVAVTAGWHPVIVATSVAYDSACLAVAEPERLLIELPFLPVEDGDAALATAAHVELLATIGAEPSGAGLLAASAFWRWASAVVECLPSDDAGCEARDALAVTEWTAGGLHPAVDLLGNGNGCAVVLGVGESGFERRLPIEPGTYDCLPERSVAVGDTVPGEESAAAGAEGAATGTGG